MYRSTPGLLHLSTADDDAIAEELLLKPAASDFPNRDDLASVRDPGQDTAEAGLIGATQSPSSS